MKNSVTFQVSTLIRIKQNSKFGSRELGKERNKKNSSLSEKDEQVMPRGTHEGKESSTGGFDVDLS